MNASRTTRTLLALLAATALPASLAAQDGPTKRLLRYRFEEGASGSYLLTQDASMKMKMGERTMDTKMHMELSMGFRIAEVKDGGATIEQEITRMKMSMDNPMTGKMEFDTAEEDSVPAMFDRVLDAIGQKVRLQLDARGEPRNVEVPSAIEELGSGMDIEQMVGRFMTVLPEEPVAIGEKWSTSASQAMGQGIEVALTVENELKAVDGDRVTLGMVMDIAVDASELPGEFTIEDSVGTMVIDLGKGLLESSTMDMDVRMKMSEGPMEMVMDMDTKLSIGRAPKAESGAKDGNGEKK